MHMMVDKLMKRHLYLQICGQVVAGLAGMLHFRSKGRSPKRERGRRAEAGRVAASVGEDLPRPPSVAISLVYVVIAVAFTAYATVNFDAFPARIAMHADFAGKVDSWVQKSLSPSSLLFPVLFTAIMGLVFTFAHFAILKSKKPVDPLAPALSALAYARFSRTMAWILFAGGVGLSLVTGVCFYASALGLATLATMGNVIMVVSLAFLVVMVVASVRMGQAGSRMVGTIDRSGAPAQVAADKDRYWKLGGIYFNPDDPAVWVPKRFGVGWTCNFARPMSWVFLVGIFAIAIVVALLA